MRFFRLLGLFVGYVIALYLILMGVSGIGGAIQYHDERGWVQGGICLVLFFIVGGALSASHKAETARQEEVARTEARDADHRRHARMMAEENAMAFAKYGARSHQPAPVSVTRVDRERIVERQVVVMHCKFCNELTPVDLSNCRSCGGLLR